MALTLKSSIRNGRLAQRSVPAHYHGDALPTELREALLQSRAIRIDYQDDDPQRAKAPAVEPLLLKARPSSWYECVSLQKVERSTPGAGFHYRD